MISFVNAKINIGLNVVGRRQDGYHLLETCFYPVGLYNGTPTNPEPFCDILELSDTMPENIDLQEEKAYTQNGITYIFSGNSIECPPEKNLVVRAGNMFAEYIRTNKATDLNDLAGPLTLRLCKQIPDGAGLGGGSADATFTLKMLNSRIVSPLSDKELEAIAVKLGADCPVFVKNKPVYAEGIGEIFSPINSNAIEDLGKYPYWLALVKPNLSISTREAFAGLNPHIPAIPLRDALKLPLSEWRRVVKNDFEDSLFPLYPELERLKNALYDNGAIYASMTGSGAALYGIYDSRMKAQEALRHIAPPYSTIIKL